MFCAGCDRPTVHPLQTFHWSPEPQFCLSMTAYHFMTPLAFYQHVLHPFEKRTNDRPGSVVSDPQCNNALCSIHWKQGMITLQCWLQITLCPDTKPTWYWLRSNVWRSDLAVKHILRCQSMGIPWLGEVILMMITFWRSLPNEKNTVTRACQINGLSAVFQLPSPSCHNSHWAAEVPQFASLCPGCMTQWLVNNFLWSN